MSEPSTNPTPEAGTPAPGGGAEPTVPAPGGGAEPTVPAPAPGAWQPPATPEEAQAVLDEIKMGNPPPWYPAYRDGRHRGHAEAVERVYRLNQAAYPEPAPAVDTWTEPDGTTYTTPAPNRTQEEVPPDGDYSAQVNAAVPPALDGKVTDEDRAQASGWFSALSLTRTEGQLVAGLLAARGIGLDALAREHSISGRAGEIATERADREAVRTESKLRQEWGDGYDGRMGQIKTLVENAERRAPGLKAALAGTGLGNSEALIRLLWNRVERSGG